MLDEGVVNSQAYYYGVPQQTGAIDSSYERHHVPQSFTKGKGALNNKDRAAYYLNQTVSPVKKTAGRDQNQLNNSTNIQTAKLNSKASHFRSITYQEAEMTMGTKPINMQADLKLESTQQMEETQVNTLKKLITNYDLKYNNNQQQQSSRMPQDPYPKVVSKFRIQDSSIQHLGSQVYPINTGETHILKEMQQMSSSNQQLSTFNKTKLINNMNEQSTANLGNSFTMNQTENQVSEKVIKVQKIPQESEIRMKSEVRNKYLDSPPKIINHSS